MPPSSAPPGVPSGPPISGAPEYGSPFSQPYGGSYGGFGPPPPPPPSGSKTWIIVLSGFAVLILLAACGLGAYFLLKDDGKKPSANPSTSTSPSGSESESESPTPDSSGGDITSRATDPEPLTVEEMFPESAITISQTGNYPVVKTQELKDCRQAATGALGPQLMSLGCNQVVRAAVNSPAGHYGMTIGVMNLKDSAGPKAIDSTVYGNKGAFAGLPGTGASSVINQASNMMFWKAYGHYLVYCVIVRGNRGQISDKDPSVKQIAADMISTHLETRLQKREG